jgi:hypothetical protein
LTGFQKPHRMTFHPVRESDLVLAPLDERCMTIILSHP